MNNDYRIKESKLKEENTINGENLTNYKSKNVEKIDLDNQVDQKKNVLESIKNNIKRNRYLTNEFEKELYTRVNKEINNLSIDEGIKQHATR